MTRIEHLGHTSFAVERGGYRLLIDPIVARPDLDFRSAVYPEWFYGDLGVFDSVFISHGHNDHLHPPSLLGVPRTTPVHFLDEDLTTCSCDEDPRVLLPSLGFEDIRPFRPGDAVELGGGITVHVVAAERSSEGEEQVAFLVATDDVVMFDGVDIKDSPQTRRSLEPWRGKIDVAFLPTGAALQFQGFWNQMDTLEAAGFSRWLEPRRVATCGGSLSLSGSPAPSTLERYPKGFAEWLSVAGRTAENDSLVRQQPPFRLEYRGRELRRSVPLHPAARYTGPNGHGGRVRAVVTTFFSGYDPGRPTQRLGWVDSGLRGWLQALQPAADLLRNSQAELARLAERCLPSVNQTPAGVLAPCTLRHLHAAGHHRLAAAVSACCPPPPDDPRQLETTFFGVAEALVENAEKLGAGDLATLRRTLWIDRRVFVLRLVHIELRRLASFEAQEAAELRARHVDGLRATLDDRRPLLGVHHARLDREMAELMLGPSKPEVAGALLYANPEGVHAHRLSQTEASLLDLCDGRTFAVIVEETAEQLEVPSQQVAEALFQLLAKLSRLSVLLIDWSA
jgi:L-ascorbate metabolism protein UlaG (beta-lactamase superfamily)